MGGEKLGGRAFGKDICDVCSAKKGIICISKTKGLISTSTGDSELEIGEICKGGDGELKITGGHFVWFGQKRNVIIGP